VGKTARPPPIVLTAPINLMKLNSEMKSILKGRYEYRNTRNGTRMVTSDMSHYLAAKNYFDSQKLPYFTFYPKWEKPIKAVIRHLPIDTSAEDISHGLVKLGFDILNVKQLTSKRAQADGGTQPTNISLFLVTLKRSPKSQEIFKLTTL
jgi:hypothetical protein